MSNVYSCSLSIISSNVGREWNFFSLTLNIRLILINISGYPWLLAKFIFFLKKTTIVFFYRPPTIVLVDNLIKILEIRKYPNQNTSI